jgi:hypothetical protein
MDTCKRPLITLINQLNSSEPRKKVCRMWCAKVGVFYYLFRRLFLNINENTFLHCMEYVQLALNSYGQKMVDDITSSPNSQLSRNSVGYYVFYLFKGSMEIERKVHSGMKTLIQLLFQLFNPPTDTLLPFWDVLVDEDKSEKGMLYVFLNDI